MTKTKTQIKKDGKKRTQTFRGKKMAEGSKRFDFYLDSEALDDLEKIESVLLKKLGKNSITPKELFTDILAEHIDWGYTIGALECEIEELKDEIKTLKGI